jgi:hypothetical protein
VRVQSTRPSQVSVRFRPSSAVNLPFWMRRIRLRNGSSTMCCVAKRGAYHANYDLHTFGAFGPHLTEPQTRRRPHDIVVHPTGDPHQQRSCPVYATPRLVRTCRGDQDDDDDDDGRLPLIVDRSIRIWRFSQRGKGTRVLINSNCAFQSPLKA